MALFSATTSSACHYDFFFPSGRSWSGTWSRGEPRQRRRPRSGGGGRLELIVRAATTADKPAVPAEKGKYSYEVETVIERLSKLPPRGSIAKCLDMVRHRISLHELALVFGAFSRSGDWQRSLRLFNYMQRTSWCRPDEHIRAVLIGILGRQGPALLDRCSEIFHDIPVASRTALSYTAIIAAYARNARHADALALLDEMKAGGIAPTAATYNAVLAACARATDPPVPFDTMLGLFAEMRHDTTRAARPNISTYNSLLAAAASQSLADQSEMLLRTMLEAGVSPDRVSYGHLINAFGRVNRLDHAAELLSEIAAAGHVPDATAYCILMEAHARAGAAGDAVAVLRRMQADGCAPTATTYRILLDLYGKQGRFEGVRDLFREMKANAAPDTATYNVLVRVFGDGGYFREVVELFHDMLEVGVEPDMETYEGIMAACGRGGLHEDARAVLAHMSSNGVLPSAKAYTGLVEALGQAALYEEAYVAFNTMNVIGSLPTIETYNSLVHSFARGGLFKEVQGIVSRLDDAGIQKSKDTYDGMIEAYCHGAQLDEAVKAYVQMRKSMCDPDERSLEGVLHAYCIAGLVEESKEQFQELQSMVTVPSIIAYCMMLSLYARNDRWSDAYDILEEMERTHSSSAHQVIGSMIKGKHDDGSKWQMVEYVLDNSISEGCAYSSRFFNALLDVLWWFGQKARAARVLDQAVKCGLFPELFRQSNLVWSVDVHRMSIGGALVAVSLWLNQLHDRLKGQEDLPQLASVIISRGVMEKSTVSKGLPIAQLVHSLLRDNLPSTFHSPRWNPGRITCLRPQLKKLQLAILDSSNGSATTGFVPITNLSLPSPGSKVYSTETQVGSDARHLAEDSSSEERQPELLAL